MLSTSHIKLAVSVFCLSCNDESDTIDYFGCLLLQMKIIVAVNFLESQEKMSAEIKTDGL